MTTLVLPPNVEAEVSAFLRAQPEIVALVADRVYTALPTDVVWPAVRVVQFFDTPHTTRPLWVIDTQVQIEAFGGTKVEAYTLAATIRAVLADRLVATSTVVTDVRLSGLQDLPDTSATPARPRWLQTATITAHPPKP